MNILPDKYFKTVFEWLSLTWQFASITSWALRFLNTDISHGSVATFLRYGRIFYYESFANFPVRLSVKEFWKSINIWGSYRQEFSVLFFLTHCVLLLLLLLLLLLAAGSRAGSPAATAVRGRSSKCGQCRIYSRRRSLNADLFVVNWIYTVFQKTSIFLFFWITV